METILSIRNCHRAQTVRPIGEPNSPVYEFGWREKAISSGMFGGRYNHIATASDGTQVEIADRDLKEWVVVAWKYNENLEHLWGIGVNAFSGTSHTPEERAAQYIREYEAEMQEDLSIMPEHEKEAYVEKYAGWVSTLFGKHSRIASAMIVGPARFPTNKNERASNAYDTAYQDFRAWREKYLKGIHTRIEAAKPQSQKDDEEWQAIRSDILSTAGTLLAIDTQNAPYYRSAFVSNLYGRMSTLAKNGKIEMLKRATEFIKEQNEKLKAKGGKAIFTGRHKFWNLLKEAEEEIAKKAAKGEREDREYEFDGGKIVMSFSEDRLQIFHDTKPEYSVISTLKKEGWRWSRNNMCWQRQLTSNACYSAARVIIGTEAPLEEITKLAKMLCQGLQE